VLVLLLLLEGPKMRAGLLGMMSPAPAERYSRIAREINRSVTGYMLGNFTTSIIAGVVVFVTLLVLGVPYPLLWALWVALVDFLPMIGGALAGIPTVLFAAGHSLTAGIITLVVFLIYTQIENHVLNPVVMSRTVKVNPLLVLVSILIGASIGSWIGGTFGGFVAALLAIPTAGALQVTIREIWQATAPEPTEAAASDPGADGHPDGNGTTHRLLPAIAGTDGNGDRGTARREPTTAPAAGHPGRGGQVIAPSMIELTRRGPARGQMRATRGPVSSEPGSSLVRTEP
jgi:hypothetical protein